MTTAPLRLPRMAAFAVMLLVAATTVLPAASADTAAAGELTVATSPQVDAEIRVNDEPRNRSELRGLTLPVGEHTVCFSVVDDYLPPPCQTVEISEGETAHVTGEFEPAGWIEVTTEPETLDAAISIDGELRDRRAVLLPVSAGAHEVCFGPATGHEPPECRTVDVQASEATVVTGVYEPITAGEDPGEEEPIEEPVAASVRAALLHGAASRAQ
jgi:hypothetical protein